jgi:Glycosyltransferases involved in cell wall biogenesis
MGQPDGGITAAVSIVIPLYNQLEYTRGCLDSLRRTSAADVELILVDNASSDGTADYLQTVPGSGTDCQPGKPWFCRCL